MHIAHKLIYRYLYESLHKLKLRGLIGVIGSVSFGESTESRTEHRFTRLSDLDLIIILTLTSYIKHLMFQTLHQNLKLPTKIKVKDLKVSISCENLRISWLLGTINYVNLFELKIISPKRLLPERASSPLITQIPLENIFELFISCLADLISIYNAKTEKAIYHDEVLAKRLKFLGYIYCLANNLDFLNTYRNRTLCLELLKSQLKDECVIDLKNINGSRPEMLITFFTKVFVKHVLRNLEVDKFLNNKLIANTLINSYLNILLSRRKKRILMILTGLFKYILRRSVVDLIDLRLRIKRGYNFSDFLRLAVLIVVKRVLEKEHVSKNLISNLCHLWDNYMM